MSGLPKSWVKVPIGAFAVDCGQRIPTEEDEFTYIDIGSVNRETKKIESPQVLAGKDAPSRARKHVYAGDTLVSMTRPNLNAVALVGDDLDGQIASTGFDVLRAPGIDPRWVFYLVRTTKFVQAMSDLVQGALYPAVRSKDVRGFEAPLAPLPEQKRIADKLDTVLARVDACRDRLDRVPAILKRFRQSVLTAAVSGSLSEDWRASVPATTEGAWQSIPLGDLVEDGPTNGLYKHVSEYGEGTPILRIDMFYDGEVTGWGNTKRLNTTDSELEKFGLTVGDIVVNRVNSPPLVGKSALIRTLPEPCVFESNMMRLRLKTALVSPEYCIRFLNSPLGLSRLRQNVT